MIKKISVLFIALAFISTAIAQDKRPGSETKIIPDLNYQSQAPVSNPNILHKISAIGETFVSTDYDYAGNNVIPKMISLADIDGEGDLDPFFVAMVRNNSATVARYVAFGYSAFESPIDAFRAFAPTLSCGWGTTQLCVGGPLDGQALVMAHSGGTANQSIIDLVNLSPVQPFPTTKFGSNFPDFFYLHDGSIWAMDTNADIFFSSDAGTTFNQVSTIGAGDTTVTIVDPANNGPSENAIYGSSDGKYMSTVGGWKTMYDQGQGGGLEDGLYLYRTSDFGANWTGSVIGLDGYFDVANNPDLAPFFENFGQLNANVDENGVTHVVINGYGAGVNANRDTVNAFPLLYWNSNQEEWLEISIPGVAFGPSSILTDNRPGNGIGQAYPSVSVTDDGQFVFVIWAAPEYKGTVGTSDINVFPGDGTANSGPIFYTDLHWTVSTDGGQTWAVPQVLGEQNVSETYPNVARRLEVLENNDVKAHFLFFADGMPGTSVFNSNAPNQNAEVLGTWQYYSMIVGQHTVSVDQVNNSIPTAYDLGQNYPNPFNPSTTIRFSIPEAGMVTLRVFNLLGEEVATLLNSEKPAGVYEANFDASKLTSGIYFYTLESKNFTSTKKMLLIK